MRTKRSAEGYLQIDHSVGPGIPDELLPAHLPPRAGQRNFETSTFCCSHCPNQVINNPLRTRERGYCRKCDSYLCDRCTAIAQVTKECRPWEKVLDTLQEQGAKDLAFDDNGSIVMDLGKECALCGASGTMHENWCPSKRP